VTMFYSGEDLQSGIETLASWLKESRSTVILSGAGMDTQSNIPDFRSQSGWWKNIDPSKVASVTALQRNYPLFREFYIQRLKMLENVKPHPGHYVLAELEQKSLLKSIATQNVSGLHRQAGSKNVYELHGNITTIRCNHCESSAELEDFLAGESCKICGHDLLRPNVVLFGEFLPQEAWNAAEQDIRQSELLIVIGTSLNVAPVNQFPKIAPGRVVLLNNEDVDPTYKFDLKIIDRAKEVLEELKCCLD
jgi:NAD-dependent deacetylase